LPAASDDPLISVILACYNQEKFVGEAVDGVLSQTYSPLEIVIVDDCSSDGTARVIASKIAEHPERDDVRLVRNDRNLTMMRSTPRAIGMTKGDFVVLASGDDILLPNMVEEVAKVWRAQDVSLVITNATYIDDKSEPLNRTFRDPNEPADDSFETIARDGANACCFGPCMSFERELFDTFGIPPTHLECADIMYPFYAYLLKGAKFISKPLFKYRVHAANTSLSLIAEKRSDERERLFVQQRDFSLRLNHAVFMEEELDRLRSERPERYANLAGKTLPLLAIQIVETAKKLVRVERQLAEGSSKEPATTPAKGDDAAA